jgi:AcrR family transcriptional regulator
VPRLWTETIAAHREAVRDATLDAAAALVAEHGLASVSMSRIAAATGIGRATLYKYFPDVESILRAWHERQINTHLDNLAETAAGNDDPRRRVEAVCQLFASIQHQRHAGEFAALLHRGEHVTLAHQRLREFLTQLLADAVAAGQLRDDVPAAELADYCLHALTAAGQAQSPEAVGRLVNLTLAGLRPDAPRVPSELSPRRTVTHIPAGKRSTRRQR